MDILCCSLALSALKKRARRSRPLTARDVNSTPGLCTRKRDLFGGPLAPVSEADMRERRGSDHSAVSRQSSARSQRPVCGTSAYFISCKPRSEHLPHQKPPSQPQPITSERGCSFPSA